MNLLEIAMAMSINTVQKDLESETCRFGRAPTAATSGTSSSMRSQRPTCLYAA